MAFARKAEALKQKANLKEAELAVKERARKEKEDAKEKDRQAKEEEKKRKLVRVHFEYTSCTRVWYINPSFSISLTYLVFWSSYIIFT